ncbi:uncharacterized protein LOC127607994 [Hippocampus zosterae]|uniref:uncharacterized protein LOC127607994 n=1 Tax=Hippocampus zosterae TaxID=109293 RepID=UPI00223DDC89|nr:uncharacterized protein LOC127607994 [Hippocampus zosterae]
MKRIDVDGKPHLCLFAINDIQKGEEITYDYGGEDCPWRTQMTSMMVTDVAPQPSSLPQGQMYDDDDDDGCPLNTLQEMTKTTPKEATLLEPCCDTAGPSKIHQMTKTTPKEATLPEPCCDSAGPSNIRQNLEVTHSDLSVEYVLRLRRTKSIFMKDNVPEDSDELFYSTQSSGDDLIPDTTSKSDTDKKLLESEEDSENMLSDDGTPMDETESGDIIHKRSKPHKRCKPPSSDDDEQPSGVRSKKCSSKGERSESDNPCQLTPKRRTPFSNKDRPSSDDDEIPSSIPAKRFSFKG